MNVNNVFVAERSIFRRIFRPACVANKYMPNSPETTTAKMTNSLLSNLSGKNHSTMVKSVYAMFSTNDLEEGARSPINVSVIVQFLSNQVHKGDIEAIPQNTNRLILAVSGLVFVNRINNAPEAINVTPIYLVSVAKLAKKALIASQRVSSPAR